MRFRPRFFISLLLLLLPLFASGQERAKFLSLETGIDFIDSQDSGQKDYLRAESPDYNNGVFSRSIRYETHRIFTGARIEIRSRNDRFGFLSGLRFTQLSSSITKNSSPHYFYFLLQQTGTTTEYLRVRKLNQTSNYLGVPVEVRIFPYGQKTFRLYFLIGCEISYQLATKTEADFTDPSMKIYQSDVAGITGAPDKWCSAFYGRAGFIFGKDIPRIGIGITSPITLSGSSSSLTTPTVGAGFHLQVQFPI
jgi:hypothetical protein